MEHQQSEELYVAIYSTRDSDVILFSEQGGVDVGDIDEKARKVTVPVTLKDTEMGLSQKDLDTLIGAHKDKR